MTEKLKPAYPENGWLPLLSAYPQSTLSTDQDNEVPQFTMSDIMSYFVTRCLEDSLPSGDFKSISKSSENLFRCGHVQNIQVSKLDDSVYVKSQCLLEMRKDQVYCVRMRLSKSLDILNAECGCPAGCGPCASCKHIGALSYALADFFRILTAQEVSTCTDRLQQWNHPRGRKVDRIPVDKLGDRRRELLPSKIRDKGSKMIYDPRPPHLRTADSLALENLRCELLRIDKPCALLNVIVPSPEKIALDHNYCAKPGSGNVLKESDRITFCDPDVFSKVFPTKTVTAEDIIEKLSIGNEQQKDLEERTRAQSSNDVWFAERQNRITGSKCGRILQQKKKTTALLQSTIYSKPFTHVPKAIQWGKDKEEIACKQYERYMQSNGHVGLQTRKAGFVVDVENCWLGASPDAWVSDPSVDSEGIAEFKCPYSMADKTPEEMCNYKSSCLVSASGIPSLKRDHPYFHQVQLQLYVTRSLVKW